MLQTKSFTMFPTEVYFIVFFLSWIIKISVSMPNWKNFMNYLTSTRIQKKVGKNLTIKLTRHQAGLSLISTSLSIHKRLSFLLYFLVFKKCLFLNCLMSMVKDIKKTPLDGDVKQWTWFKICLFSKNKIDLVEELKLLNSVLTYHALFRYEEFSTSIDTSILTWKTNRVLVKKKIRKIKIKMAFNLLVIFWRTINESSSMAWRISEDFISVL